MDEPNTLAPLHRGGLEINLQTPLAVNEDGVSNQRLRTTSGDSVCQETPGDIPAERDKDSPRVEGEGEVEYEKVELEEEEDKLTMMFNSIYANDIDKLKKLISEVRDINVQDNDLYTPLLAAVQADNLEIVDLLTYAGADVNIFGLHYKPLESAMQNMNKEMVRLLLNRGGDIYKIHVYETEEVHRSNALNDAFKIGSCYKKFCTEEYIKIMLDHDNGLSNLETKGAIALNAAAAIGDVRRVKFYLNAGVKVENCLRVQTHPMLNACRYGHVDVVEILLKESGVGLDAVDPCDDAYPRGRTPLAWAIHNENFQILRLLLKSGAENAGYSNPLFFDEDSTWNGLMMACFLGRRDFVEEILSHGQIDVNNMNEDAMTALHFCFHDHERIGKSRELGEDVAIVKDLLLACADNVWKPCVDFDSSTPLDFHLNHIFPGFRYHRYFMISVGQIRVVALILKACIFRSSFAHFINLMRRVSTWDAGMPEWDLIASRLTDIDGILRIAIMSGNIPTEEFIQAYDKFLTKWDQINKNKEWLLDIARNGFTLKQLSRMKLRQIIRRPLLVNAHAPEIRLPRILKEYILFDDIVDTDAPIEGST